MCSCASIRVFSLLLGIPWGFLWITLLYAGHQALQTFALSRCLVTERRVSFILRKKKVPGGNGTLLNRQMITITYLGSALYRERSSKPGYERLQSGFDTNSCGEHSCGVT